MLSIVSILSFFKKEKTNLDKKLKISRSHTLWKISERFLVIFSLVLKSVFLIIIRREHQAPKFTFILNLNFMLSIIENLSKFYNHNISCLSYDFKIWIFWKAFSISISVIKVIHFAIPRLNSLIVLQKGKIVMLFFILHFNVFYINIRFKILPWIWK